MNIISSSPAMLDLAANHPDPDFRTLLSRLLAAISCDGEFDPGELLRLVIIGPGDILGTVNAALDFRLTPEWEACDREGGWTALTYILSDWGEGIIALLPNQPGIDPALRKLAV